MPSEYPAVIPMRSYESGTAALEWLARAFGEDLEGQRWMFLEHS